MAIWYFGNTTVRSPFRLRDGLIALSKANLEGNLHGTPQEKELIRALVNLEVINSIGDDTYSVGRKWRSALNKMGFLIPQLMGSLKPYQLELGAADTISENGLRLMRADTVIGWQECYLRSIAAYFIPSPNDAKIKGIQHFSPLRYILKIMIGLATKTGDSTLNFIELAAIVQCTTPADDIETTLDEILKLRSHRKLSDSKRKFDKGLYEALAKLHSYKLSTFRDYADLNIRYLKATGLFHSKGKGLSLSDEKKVLIDKLLLDVPQYPGDLNYLKQLCAGAKLPFDNQNDALVVLSDLVERLKQKGEGFDLTNEKLDNPADIAIVRHKIEERLSQLYEIEFANKQVSQVVEIIEYLNLIVTNKSTKELDSGIIIEIPSAEKPAYFEWVIWRAFLAMNSLVNHPWESRQFKIDQDFYPISHASGGRPDLVFEFQDMILIVEVTLTSSSRQEAAEGEPVRRHVAKYAEEHISTGKYVFGLFIAIKIDTNTANTFRLGEWYLKDDRKINLHIVPVCLADFNYLFSKFSHAPSSLILIIKQLLMRCRMESNRDAPEWKRLISQLIQTCGS